jgi:hypothetical protein
VSGVGRNAPINAETYTCGGQYHWLCLSHGVCNGFYHQKVYSSTKLKKESIMDKLTQDQVNDAMNKTYGNRAAFVDAVKKYGFGVAVSAALMSNANAAPIDITAVVTTITDGVTTVSAIGLAVLSLVVVIKVFKWARSAM